MASALFRSGFCNTPLWDVNRSWNAEVPVLTTCFEDSVLVWIPVILFWTAVYFKSYNAPPRLPDGLASTLLSGLRYAFSMLFVVLTTIFTIFEFIEGSPPATLLAGGLKTASYVIAYLLFLSDRQRGQKRHILLWFFWFGMSVFELPAYYGTLVAVFGTQPQRMPPTPSEFSCRVVTFPLLLIQLVLFSLSDTLSEDNTQVKCESRSELATPPSFLVFEWATSIVLTAYRKTLRFADLLGIPQSLTSRLNFQCWKLATKETTVSPPFVSVTILKLFWQRILVGSLLYLSSSLFKLISGLFLFLIIRHLQIIEEEPWKGYFFVAVMFLVNSVCSITLQHANFTLTRVGIRVKALISTALYTKSLRIPTYIMQRQMDELTSLMSNDAKSVGELASVVAILVTSAVPILFACVVLWRYLGPSSLAGMVTVIIVVPVVCMIGHQCQNLMERCTSLRTSRLQYTSDALQKTKVAEADIMDTSFAGELRSMHLDEVLVLRTFSYWSAVMSAAFKCAPLIVAIMAFAAFLILSDFDFLGPERAFVALYFFDGLFLILLGLVNNLLHGRNVLESAEKVERFLLSSELSKYVDVKDDYETVISFKDATLLWSVTSPRALCEVTISVNPGQLVAVVGLPRCGKSAVLSAIIGELIIERGSVTIASGKRVAYIPHEPWILNGTVRRNIVLNKRYDATKYNRVMEVCHLKSNIQTFPKGDETEIGARGTYLRKELKQRICLARALYQDSDIYLLDDSLNAVDIRISASIYANVVEPGGLLSNKTRIVVTDSRSTISSADNILFVKERAIVASGTYKNLIEDNEGFAKYIKEQVYKGTKTKSEDPDAVEAEPLAWADAGTEDTSLKHRLDHQRKVSAQSIAADKEMIPKRQTYIRYLTQAGITMSLVVLFAFLMSRTLGIGATLWLGDLTTDRKFQLENLSFGMGIYFVLVILQAAASGVATYALVRGTINVFRELHDSVSRKQQPSERTYLHPKRPKRFTNSVDMPEVLPPTILNSFLDSFFNLFSLTVLVSSYEPFFLLPALIFYASYSLVKSLYLATIRQTKRLENSSRRDLYSFVTDTVAGLSNIRGCSMEDTFVDRFETLVDDNHASAYTSLVSKLWTSTRLDVVSNVLVLVVGVIVIALRGSIGAGSGAVLMYWAMSSSSSFINMAFYSADMQAAAMAYEYGDEKSGPNSKGPDAT